jgi:hypothetical protein
MAFGVLICGRLHLVKMSGHGSGGTLLSRSLGERVLMP